MLVTGVWSVVTAQDSQVKIEVGHDMSREGRWLFRSTSSDERPLPVIGRRWNNDGYYGKELRARLNDGGVGRVRFRESPQIIHEPNDSLKLQGDDYFVEVIDAKERIKDQSLYSPVDQLRVVSNCCKRSGWRACR
ncbi:MAG: hypothetical protein J2P21_07090 [Chloracidobacterium sp.]|nr:hypothetical protein [Chloracidobacterium sp.]